MNDPQPRSKRSYKLVNPELVQASIRFKQPQSSAMPAELREISPNGAKLLLSGSPEQLCACEILLSTHRFKHPLLLNAEIEWVRPNPAGEWLVGCRFDKPLSDEVFQELIDSGVLNRRASVRERSKIPISVQLQPHRPRQPAIISDFSEGGLCLTVGSAPERTRHVCLFGVAMGREVRVPLKIRWVLPALPNHFVGCQFMRRADYQVIRSMHLQMVQQSLREQSRAVTSLSESASVSAAIEAAQK
jgi:PilZ domain-containing protein